MATTPLASLIDSVVRSRSGKSLADYVAERRSNGTGWRTIAAELTTMTGTDVSYETLRSWFRDDGATPGGTP